MKKKTSDKFSQVHGLSLRRVVTSGGTSKPQNHDIKLKINWALL